MKIVEETKGIHFDVSKSCYEEKEVKKKKEISYHNENMKKNENDNDNEKKNFSERRDVKEKNEEEEKKDKIRYNFLLLKWKELVRIGMSVKRDYSPGKEHSSSFKNSNLSRSHIDTKKKKFIESLDNETANGNFLEGNSICDNVSTCILQYVVQLENLCIGLSSDVRACLLDRDLELEEHLSGIKERSKIGRNKYSDNNGLHEEPNNRNISKSINMDDKNTSNSYHYYNNNNYNDNNNYHNNINSNNMNDHIDENTIKNKKINDNEGGINNDNYANKNMKKNINTDVKKKIPDKKIKKRFESTVIETKNVLKRVKNIFKKCEDLCSIIVSFIEIITPTPKVFHNNLNEIQYISIIGIYDNKIKSRNIKTQNNDDIQSSRVEESSKLRDILNTIVQSCCTAIESVCTVMYVLPTFFVISSPDWSAMISCLLDCRSACVYVLTVLTEYNSAWKKYLNKDTDYENKNCPDNERRKKINKVFYNVPTADLESSLNDFEIILLEEVRNLQ